MTKFIRHPSIFLPRKRYVLFTNVPFPTKPITSSPPNFQPLVPQRPLISDKVTELYRHVDHSLQTERHFCRHFDHILPTDRVTIFFRESYPFFRLSRPLSDKLRASYLRSLARNVLLQRNTASNSLFFNLDVCCLTQSNWLRRCNLPTCTASEQVKICSRQAICKLYSPLVPSPLTSLGSSNSIRRHLGRSHI